MDPIAAIATISTARPATPIATHFIWKAVAGCWLVAGWLLVGCWLPDGDGPSNRPQPATSNQQVYVSEVVSNPNSEARLAEVGAAALRREQHVFPVLVEQRAPRPVEVDGEAERERLEADAVRGTPVLQTEAADVARR